MTLRKPIVLINGVLNELPVGDSVVEKIKYTDYSDTRYFYVGLETKIRRIDHSVSPPLIEVATTSDWVNRTSHTYF